MKRNFIFMVLSLLLLSACNGYTVPVDLDAKTRQLLEAKIELLQDRIQNFKPEQNEQDWFNIIDLANTYERLGELGNAIKEYEKTLEKETITSVILNNLGRLYEKTGQYEKAIEMYQRIVNEFFDARYYYDITWSYIHLKDRKNAEKYFNLWQQALKKTDEQTQDAIKKLREEEKAK